MWSGSCWVNDKPPNTEWVVVEWCGGVEGHNPLGHNPPRSESPVQWQGRIKPTQNDTGGSEPGGYVWGVYVRQSWNLAFRTPFPVTENDNVHNVHNVLTQGVCPGGYVRQSTYSSNVYTALRQTISRETAVEMFSVINNITASDFSTSLTHVMWCRKLWFVDLVNIVISVGYNVFWNKTPFIFSHSS